VKISAFIFLSLTGFFTVQPLMSSLGVLGSAPVAKAGHCCSKMMKCPKKSHPSDKERKCSGDGCNPFMACAYGNFFVMVEGRMDLSSVAPDKERWALLNDCRLSAGLSESWHPPEDNSFNIG
jgi:hypothetical protein